MKETITMYWCTLDVTASRIVLSFYFFPQISVKYWWFPFPVRLQSRNAVHREAKYNVFFFFSVNGGWSPWGPWSTCTASCDGGMWTRTRNCTFPEPQHGGYDCGGISWMNATCNQQPCPGKNLTQIIYVNFFYRKQNTTYKLLIYNEQFAKNQFSTGKESSSNVKKMWFVVVDGHWSDWSPWTSCTKTCGGGFRWRYRFCDEPLPSGTGADCVGSTRQNFTCNFAECPSTCVHRLYWDPDYCSLVRNASKISTKFVPFLTSSSFFRVQMTQFSVDEWLLYMLKCAIDKHLMLSEH